MTPDYEPHDLDYRWQQLVQDDPPRRHGSTVQIVLVAVAIMAIWAGGAAVLVGVMDSSPVLIAVGAIVGVCVPAFVGRRL